MSEIDDLVRFLRDESVIGFLANPERSRKFARISNLLAEFDAKAVRLAVIEECADLIETSPFISAAARMAISAALRSTK